MTVHREWIRSFEGGELRLRLYPEGFAQPEHTHPWTTINVVLSGLVQETGWNTVQSLEPWCVYSRPAGLLHANRYPRRSTLVLSVLTSPRDEEERQLYEARELCGVLLSQRVVQLLALARGLEAASTRGGDLGTAAREIATAPATGSGGSPVDRARKELELDGARVDAVAAAAGMDRSVLLRRFRGRFGLSPSQYRRWSRVRRATVRLAETEEPLAGVAVAAGFSDQSHMGRDFRTCLGVTPRSYRELLRL